MERVLTSWSSAWTRVHTSSPLVVLLVALLVVLLVALPTGRGRQVPTRKKKKKETGGTENFLPAKQRSPLPRLQSVISTQPSPRPMLP